MQIGFVGLGRMGADMSRRLLAAGHTVAVTNRSADKVAALVAEGAVGAADLAALVMALTAPRAIWLMLPPGAPTEDQIATLHGLLSPGDLIIEGGNSNFHDDIRRAGELAALGIGYLDVGTSGGVWGLANGYSLMVGGRKEDYERLLPIFTALAPVGGQMYCGTSGAGHYAKMVHNGIEYGLMEAYAEGFELLAASGYEIDLPALAGVWNHGSVIRSWLLELLQDAIAKDRPCPPSRAMSRTLARAAGPPSRGSSTRSQCRC